MNDSQVTTDLTYLLMQSSQSTKRQELKLEYAQLYTVLDYSMHELPLGVLLNPDAATQSQCAELMGDLNRFEAVCKELGVETHAFVDACRWHVEHYPHYLSRRRHFASYAEYIKGRGGPLRVPKCSARLK